MRFILQWELFDKNDTSKHPSQIRRDSNGNIVVSVGYHYIHKVWGSSYFLETDSSLDKIKLRTDIMLIKHEVIFEFLDLEEREKYRKLRVLI